MKFSFVQICLVVVLGFGLFPMQARADLSSSQARKAIQTIGGISLPKDSVRVQQVRTSSAEGAEVTAQLQLVFRATQHEGHWRLSEVRTGQDRWERLDLIARAANVSMPDEVCDLPAEVSRSANNTELTTKRARCLVAALFDVALPSDEVRVRDVSPFGFSLGSSDASALIEALVRLDFHLVRERQGWQVREVKSAGGHWVSLVDVPAAVDQLKRATASNELSLIAQALDNYRRDRGFYVVSDKESVLIDHLSPKYLTLVIRLDPWSRPYQYDGEQTSYSLRSLGPDGKPNTPDDIVVKN
jgi:hypothetical protein